MKPADTSLGWVALQRYRLRAKDRYESDVLEIDPSAVVSCGDPKEGAYVQAWVWVPAEGEEAL